jgi:benzylsuccinate synthase/naphthyl-2-methylsuccinate synthase gamma subunit
MATCEECTFFFPIPEDADDYEAGKGDCVTEKKDEKGKYWLSKPVFVNSETCNEFQKS